MGEFFKSLYDHFHQRISHPLVGSITFFWLICNWKSVFYLLTADKSASKKIEFVIEAYKITDPFNIIIPVGLAVAYVLLIPYITLLIHRVHKQTTISEKELLAEKDYAYEIEILRQKQKATDMEAKLLSDQESLLQKRQDLEAKRQEFADQSGTIEDEESTKRPTPQNPTKIENFKKTYKTADIEHNRVVAIIDYLLEIGKDEKFLSLRDNRVFSDIDWFVNLVKNCDPWAKKNGTDYVPLDKVFEIGKFRDQEKFPQTHEQWDYFLNSARPDFDPNKFSQIMDRYVRDKM